MTTMDKQTADILTNKYRREFQGMDDRTLSHMVLTVAMLPRNMDKLRKQALLLTAADRLWKANAAGSPTRYLVDDDDTEPAA